MTGPSVEAERAIAELETGEPDAIRRALAGLAAREDPASVAWRMAIDAARWQIWPAEAPLPTAADLRRVAGSSTEVRAGIASACASGARAAFIAFDRAGLDGYHALLEEVAARPTDEVRARLAGILARILRGDTGTVEDDARELFGVASKLEMAGAAIVITSSRALGALANGDAEAAISHARRASRMAQTEALPQHSYLAHLVLARVRRVTGRPHLGSHILLALARVVPPPWHGWLRWELAMAGGRAAVTECDRDLAGVPGMPSMRTADALEATLASLEERGRDPFEARAEELVQASAAYPELRRDAVDLLYAVDPRCPLDDPTPELLAWARGEQSLPPRGIQGVGLAEAGGADAELAMVLAEPGGNARRMLGAGARLIPEGTEPLPIQRTSRHKGRAETALCALALAGGELSDAELFEQVYGFAYSPALHAGVMDVMLHRIRGRLGDAGVLSRQGERVTFAVARPLLIADPRCARAVDERLLATIARQRGATAKEAAKSLGLPLRTVQAGLQKLVEEGICIAERQGNRVEYRVEDTTFSEPTRH